MLVGPCCGCLAIQAATAVGFPLQSVMLVELDGARTRTVGVQVVGTQEGNS